MFTSRTITRARFALPILAIAAAALSTPASAAPIRAVVDACDRTAGCTYHISKYGTLTGCSPVICFSCNRSTCIGFKQTPAGKKPVTIPAGKGADPLAGALARSPAKPDAKPPVQGFPKSTKETKTSKPPVQGLPRPRNDHAASTTGQGTRRR